MIFQDLSTFTIQVIIKQVNRLMHDQRRLSRPLLVCMKSPELLPHRQKRRMLLSHTVLLLLYPSPRFGPGAVLILKLKQYTKCLVYLLAIHYIPCPPYLFCMILKIMVTYFTLQLQLFGHSKVEGPRGDAICAEAIGKLKVKESNFSDLYSCNFP